MAPANAAIVSLAHSAIVRARAKLIATRISRRQTLADADALPGSDYEDNIQVVAAVATGLNGIVARDACGFSQAPVQVWSPTDLLQ